MTQNINPNEPSSWAGRNALILARSSTSKQQVSIEDQIQHAQRFAAEHGVQIVGQVANAGLSASKTWARDDLKEVKQRKREQDDFDLLLVYDASRWSRGGAEDGIANIRDMGRLGVDVVYTSEPQYEGPMRVMHQAMSLTAANEQARSISKSCTRGFMTAIRAGRALPVTVPPMGIDKLILGPDGTPKHQLRYLMDGTQLMLDPDTQDVLQTFRVGEGKYRKQTADLVTLAPGDPDRLQVAIDILRWRWLDNDGYPSIAARLNRAGTPSPRGGVWSLKAVERAATTEAYIGYVVGNRMTKAIYHRRGETGPEPVEHAVKVRSGGEAPSKTYRPKLDWTYYEVPKLKDLLPEELRELAVKGIEAYWERRAHGHIVKPHKSKHRHSPYILSGILRASDDGRAMRGKTSGSSKKRYYLRPRDLSHPGTKKTQSMYVPADEVEQVVVRALYVALRHAPNLREVVRRAVEAEYGDMADTETRMTRVREKILQKESRFAFILNQLETIGEERVKAILADNRSGLDALQAELKSLEKRNPYTRQQLDDMVDAVVEALPNFAKKLQNTPRAVVNQLVKLFVAKAVIDIDTRKLEVEFRIPEALLHNPQLRSLDGRLAYGASHEASNKNSLPLMKYRIWRLKNESLLWLGVRTPAA